MATDTKAQEILAELERVADAHGIDIVDVECTGATKAPCVRVRIDWASSDASGISLDEVAQETKWISEALDEIDPFSGSYTLEVSSPGLDRPLRRLKDFERFAGEDVVLSTNATEGRKKFSGSLVGVRDSLVVLSVDNEERTFALSDIKRCTIKPNFAELSKKK